MIRNLFLKLFSDLAAVFPLKYILFESVPEFSNNAILVLNEMIARNLHLKYKMVWICSNYSQPYKEINGVRIRCIRYKDRWTYFYYLIRSICAISCTSPIRTYGKKQKSLYLSHGGLPLKLIPYKLTRYVDFMIAPSRFGVDLFSKVLDFPKERFVITGIPMYDGLLNKDIRETLKSIWNQKYDKFIVWYPTFRQHANSNIIDSKSCSIPLLHDATQINELNNFARERKTLIIIKPHPTQDLSLIKGLELSNIKMIFDDFFETHHIYSYEFLSGCDALVTDYSSVYFDYLLCDKPIAVIWEDIEEYRKNRGFAVDIDYYTKGACKIYNLNEFKEFIDNVYNDVDHLKAERAEIRDIIFKYRDSNNTQRVVDFIMKECL
jgi:hypothetical protein